MVATSTTIGGALVKINNIHMGMCIPLLCNQNYFINGTKSLPIFFVNCKHNCVKPCLSQPCLGLATKARACKGVGQERSPRVWESMRMNTHTPK
jgi:hypothetical protein